MAVYHVVNIVMFFVIVRFLMSDFMKVLIDFPIYWHRKKYNKENYHNIDHVKLFEYKTMVNNLKWILVKIHLYLHVLKTVRKYHIFFRFVLENMSIYEILFAFGLKQCTHDKNIIRMHHGLILYFQNTFLRANNKIW